MFSVERERKKTKMATKQLNAFLLKMGQGILGYIHRSPVPYVPEHSAGLQLSGVRAMELRSPENKKGDSVQSRGIKT